MGSRGAVLLAVCNFHCPPSLQQSNKHSIGGGEVVIQRDYVEGCEGRENDVSLHYILNGNKNDPMGHGLSSII